MTWFLLFLAASVLSSVLVLAAGMLSSRMGRHDDYVETYLTEPNEMPVQTAPTSGE